jgi:hypothetical protein
MFCLACMAGTAAGGAQSDPAAALRGRFLALQETLETSPIQPGLHVESVDNSRAPRGDAYAVIDLPFAMVASAFHDPATICESLILHLNVQYCRAEPGGGALALALGRKTNQQLEDTHRIRLDFRRDATGDDYLRVELTARDGPLDTGNYLIAMELVALDDRRAFMHIRYAYTQGMLARVATSLYFATGGHDKVGFSTAGGSAGGAPLLVRGIQGVLERNTMRYFLAFNAWLHTQHLPASQRFEASLERWFADTERFPRQLHELPREEYLAIKRSQYRRQQLILQASR